MKIDCISDLHGHYPELEGGDLLIIGGDLTAHDRDEEHRDFILWLAQIQKSKNKYKKIIYIAGNHDNFLYDPNLYGVIKTTAWNIEYLCDFGTEFEGLKIWGSPWTLTFKGMNPHCKAFTVDTEEELQEKWKNIPEDIDILITHSPPWGVMDEVKKHPQVAGENCGSMHLFLILKYSVRPRLHVFGHIHEGYGQQKRFAECISVNASHVNERYEPVNKPIRIEL